MTDPMEPTARSTTSLAVIGAGPCGIAVGAAARKAGVDCTLLDRGPLCASLLGYPWYMSFFSTPEKLEIEELPFVTAERNATRREALTYYRKVAEYFDLDVRLYTDVEEIHGDRGRFTLHTRDAAGRTSELLARNVVVATGGFHAPNLLEVPGEDLPHVSHHYHEAHPFWRRRVVVVGGGNSAVEAALELYRTGADVTVVHFAHEFDRGVKPWILPDIRNRVEKGEIAVRWGHRLTAIGPDSVLLRADGSEATERLDCDHVLALTGWKADPALLLQLEVPVDPDSGVPAHDPATMETPVPGVFIAGVLAAGHDANRIFIENGRMHGRAIVRALRGESAAAPESR
jgi:thioredoxin reductase (NADPH)